MMKRLMAIILTLALAMTLWSPAARAADYATAVVKGGWLRLRDGASSDAETISAYYTGTVVTILGGSGTWYYVEAPDGNRGYMHSGYLTITGSSVTFLSSPAPAPDKPHTVLSYSNLPVNSRHLPYVCLSRAQRL